jgi:hypothetical protein
VIKTNETEMCGTYVYTILIKNNLWQMTYWKNRHRLQQDIEVDITGLGRQSLYWVHEAWDIDLWRVLVDMTIMLLQGPEEAGNFWYS